MLIPQIDRNIYRYTEQALRTYPQETARLRLLKEYLASPIGPDWIGAVQGGDFVPDQERILFRQCRSDEFISLTWKLRPVTLFLESLSRADYDLVDLRYFQELSWPQVAAQLNLAADTCRKYRGPRIIYRAVRVIFGNI